MNTNSKTASLILTAGKGSRMKGFEGNKTLLPLIRGSSPFVGSRPILLHILANLPPGPKALVVHHKKEEVIAATRPLGLHYCEQPSLNGTGGALLAAGYFLEGLDCDSVVITMGDVPFVRASTYGRMINDLEQHNLVVLGFSPEDKKQYGMLALYGNRVEKIIEWTYWNTFSRDKKQQLQVCNSGIYAARRQDLIRYIHILEKRPHTVWKERDGDMVALEEFFITDLVELMHQDGLSVGYAIAEDEREVMGVDDLPALLKAQEIFEETRI